MEIPAAIGGFAVLVGLWAWFGRDRRIGPMLRPTAHDAEGAGGFLRGLGRAS